MAGNRTVAVYLPDNLVQRVREKAERDTVSISAVVRQALSRFFFDSDRDGLSRRPLPSVVEADLPNDPRTPQAVA